MKITNLEKKKKLKRGYQKEFPKLITPPPPYPFPFSFQMATVNLTKKKLGYVDVSRSLGKSCSCWIGLI